jgi:ubiquinone/menaquinone biosynthesis C-methylase UbiE
MNTLSSAERDQKELFDERFLEYERHYDDALAQQYRDLYYHPLMFGDIELQGKKALDAMCGSGQATRWLRAHGAQVTGVDLSETAMARFRERWPQCEAHCASVTALDFSDQSFDIITVVGGLHHVHPHVKKAMAEFHRLLKPGGYLCLIEPHAGSLPDFFRKLWYSLDRRNFAPNEASIDIDRLQADNRQHFEFIARRYFGSFGYLFLINSMILRMPRALKKALAPLAFGQEKIASLWSTKLLSCGVACRWRKL